MDDGGKRPSVLVHLSLQFEASHYSLPTEPNPGLGYNASLVMVAWPGIRARLTPLSYDIIRYFNCLIMQGYKYI